MPTARSLWQKPPSWAANLAPRPEAADAGFPLHGGLVGVAGYDLVRFFERLPSHARVDDDCPEAHYIAPRSLLVFDHLTRRAALLHAGSEHERQGLRREIVRALRGGLPGPAWSASLSAAEASLSEEEILQRVGRTKEYIAAGDVYQLVLSVRFAGRCQALYERLGFRDVPPYRALPVAGARSMALDLAPRR